MRRLLCFTPEPWPTFRADVDVLLGRELPACGISVDLVTTRDTAVPWRPWSGGESDLIEPTTGRYVKHLQRLQQVLRRLRTVHADHYAAIQVRDMPLMAVGAMLAGAAKGIPLVYWMSYPISRGLVLLGRARRREGQWISWLPTWLRGVFGEWLLHRVVLPGAAMVVVQSDRMRDDVLRLGVSADRLVVVPMGVDFQAALAVVQGGAAANPWPGRPVLGYLGTLDRPRRIDVMLEMLAEIKQTLPDVLLLLVGDTSDRSHREVLNRQVDELDLSANVVITGWLPTAEAWQRIRCAHVALSPFPRGELLDSASPTKVPEYLALGLPVVCNDNPDQQAIIEASGAGSCVPYTPRAFADAVLHWLSMAPNERARHREAGREHVRRFRDYPQLAQALAAEYELRLAHRIVQPNHDAGDVPPSH